MKKIRKNGDLQKQPSEKSAGTMLINKIQRINRHYLLSFILRNKKVQTELLKLFRLKCDVSNTPEIMINNRQADNKLLSEDKHSQNSQRRICLEFPGANPFLSLPQSSEASARSSFSSSSTSVTTTRLSIPCHEHI